MIFISRCHVLPQGGVLSLMVFSKTKSELFLSQPVLSFEKLFQLKELLIADMGNLLKHINLVRWDESGPHLRKFDIMCYNRTSSHYYGHARQLSIKCSP